MRRIAIKVLWAFVIVVVAPTLAILALFPAQLEVRESIEIEAEADTIHELVRDLRNWELWNPWTTKFPGLEISYSEETRQTGDSLVYMYAAAGPHADGLAAEEVARLEEPARAEFWRMQGEYRQKIRELSDLVYSSEEAIRVQAAQSKTAAIALVRPPLEALQAAAGRSEAEQAVIASTAKQAIGCTDGDDLRDRLRSMFRQMSFVESLEGTLVQPELLAAALAGIRAAIELTEKEIPELERLLAVTKQAEDDLQATRDIQRAHYADRTAVSVLLGAIRVARLDLVHTRVMRALEEETTARIPRSRFEELITGTGVARADVPAVEERLMDLGMIRVIRTQDRLMVSPSSRIKPVSREASGVFLSLAARWKRDHVKLARVTSTLSEFRLGELGMSREEFLAGIERLKVLGAITVESDTVLFSGSESAPALDVTSLKVLAELVAHEGWRWPMYVMREQWLSRQDEAVVNPLLDDLERASIIERRITGDEEMVELKRDDGVSFRAVYGGEGRIESTHRIYYRMTGEGRKMKVTWHVTGKFGANPIHRIAGLGVPGTMRPDMQTGLQRLKAEAEKLQKQRDAEEEEGW